MRQYFTLDEAEALLPEVAKQMRAAIQAKEAFVLAEGEWRRELMRISLAGGARVNQAELGRRRSQRDLSAKRLKDAIEKIHSYGCEVKDLDLGLIDFLTLYRGREVYLCWKLGESGIEYWHGLDEGFRGRKPIDEDFRKNHRGMPRV